MTLSDLQKLCDEATPGKFHDFFYKTLNEIPIAQQQKNMAFVCAAVNMMPRLIRAARAVKNAIENEGWYSENVSEAIAALERE